MKITINDNLIISEIEKQFNQVFPYLKLEFLFKPSIVAGEHSKKYLKRISKTLGECRTIYGLDEIIITPPMTVFNLEKIFNDFYGINIKVFRKSGPVWIQSTVTDEWSLEEQNSQGEDLSKMAS